ncbi:hypothetical protein KUTeg_003704 [Tegillarca granosa]|uniref:Uncharacterized protein n=1 Tax=Tegillarca granosa TaxID=220873 RepID=A0ABQ9FSD6_TEGGR|nr:hypothetical protein KUTeg_003704 [Tegillarca granosa]
MKGRFYIILNISFVCIYQYLMQIYIYIYRPPAQFQPKLLPEISNSPRPPEGSLVPVSRKPQNRFPGSYDLESDDRVRQLEVRLTVAERSNRALLEEVLRLQGEIKSVSRRNDDLVREEKSARHELESAISSSNELLTSLSIRIKEAELKLQEEKAALTSLVSHTKGVEQAVKSSQNELIAKKDVQGTKMQQMRIDLDEALQAKSQLERVAFQMAEDIRNLKMKLDAHTAEFATVSNDLKNRSKKIEEENRIQMENLRKQNSVQSHSEQEQSHLRTQVETRINELQTQLSDLNRKREENAHSLDMMIREKDHATQTDRLQLMSKVADSVEDVNKKLLTKEIKIREEMQDRYLALEKLIQQEQQQRREVERGTREENDRKWTALKNVQDEQAQEIKELMKTEKGKTKGTLKKLDDSISIIEKQLVENKKQVDKVMAAEISQRKKHEYETAEKIADVNEKLQIATSTLQQSIGGITQSVHTNSEKLRREVRGMIGDMKESTTRGMTDLDARVNFLKQRIGDFDEKLESRVATKSDFATDGQNEASQALAENLREKVDSITMWQDTTGQKLREMELTVQKLPDEIYGLQEKQTLLKSEVNSRMNAEADTRLRDIENLKQDIQTLKMRREPKPATIQDLENVQASVRKLADSIQTVKTVLGMKIQSEQKLRISGLEDLQTQLNQVRVNSGIHSNLTTHRPDYLQPSEPDTGFGSMLDDPTPFSTAKNFSRNTYGSNNDDFSKGKDRGLKSVEDPARAKTTSPFDPWDDGASEKQMDTIKEDKESVDAVSQNTARDTTAKTPVGTETPTRQHKTPSPAKNKTPTPGKTTPNGTQRTPSPKKASPDGTVTPGGTQQTPDNDKN